MTLRQRLQVMMITASSVIHVACSSARLENSFDAYGFISPSDSQGEFIGSYPSRKDCEIAAEGWMSRQVVGNPVRAECYPVDTR